MLVCSSDKILVCVSYIYFRVSVHCVYVLVSVDFLLLSFKLILGRLFSPHHVNQGGVQKIGIYSCYLRWPVLRTRELDRIQ
jgi:hypothetical protein